MKRIVYFIILWCCIPVALTKTYAQGWPQQYQGVMLQGFYWNSYDDTKWTNLESQADELGQSFDLVWLPQSGNCGGTSMGYDDLYWFNNYNSSFGNEAELRSLISTFKQKGIKTIADVVINHRRNVSNWVDFPRETYKGVTYEMLSTDICANDDGGKTKTWASQNGYSLSTNNDTGDGWDGMRDLDHKSENVQTIVKAYLDFLKNDLGYEGFRYDMVKGYSASYTGMYNASASPEFSVGECWDGTSTIRNWIDGTSMGGKIQSAAFDFQFRYTVRNAINSGNWYNLNQQNGGNWPLVSNNYLSGSYRRYAVTFVENHDTEYRSSTDQQDPIRKDTLAANAFLLAMPGTPCVFLKHWMEYKNDIASMIAVRKAAGIHNESTYSPASMSSLTTAFANRVNGTNGSLLVVVGKTDSFVPDAAQWTKVLAGYHYAYYLSSNMNTAWADLASGTYLGKQEVTLTAVSNLQDVQLVYTTDGSTPTAQSPRVASGSTVALPVGSTTLTVGLLVGNTVEGLLTRQYVVSGIPDFCTRADDEVCAFFEAPPTWKDVICCWAWTSSPADNFTYAQRQRWPGTDCVYLGTAANGNKVWKWTWDGKKQNNTDASQPAYIIFSNNGSPQTDDLIFTNGGYYAGNSLFDEVPTAIEGIRPNHAVEMDKPGVYDLQGRRINVNDQVGNLRKGIYIINGRKVVIR